VEKSDLKRNHSSANIASRSVSRDGYGRFLAAVFDEWVKKDIGRVSVQIFEDAYAKWLGYPGEMCSLQPLCGNALALEHNGDVYSCDHFVDPDHYLGNVIEMDLLKLVTLDQQRRFGDRKTDFLPEACKVCEFVYFCQGGCPKNRYPDTGKDRPGKNYLCPSYQNFFAQVLPWMERIHVKNENRSL
jgi:uncharacterized protein